MLLGSRLHLLVDFFHFLPPLGPRLSVSPQPIGGATHVDRDSSLEFLWDVKFLGNTLAYQTDYFWVRAAVVETLICVCVKLFFLFFVFSPSLRDPAQEVCT